MEGWPYRILSSCSLSSCGSYPPQASLETDSRDCDNRKADMQLPSMTYPSEPGPLLDTSIQTCVAFLSDQVALIEPRRRVSESGLS